MLNEVIYLFVYLLGYLFTLALCSYKKLDIENSIVGALLWPWVLPTCLMIELGRKIRKLKNSKNSDPEKV